MDETHGQDVGTETKESGSTQVGASSQLGSANVQLGFNCVNWSKEASEPGKSI
jgi:hypothetical protein